MMKNRIGILAGIPVLLFFGWFLWTEVLNQQNFPEWEQEILAGIQTLSPEAVSTYRIGDVDNYPGNIYRLTPRTEEQRIREEQFWRSIRAEREDLDTSRLSVAQLESYEAIRLTESSVLDLPWEWWAMNLFHPEYGIQQKLPLFLIHSHHIEEVDDCEGYLYRIRELPKRLEEAIIETERVASIGWAMNANQLKQAAAQLRAWAATPVKEQEIYRSFGKKVTRLDPTVINEYQELDYLIDASTSMEEDLIPLLSRIANRLEQINPSERNTLTRDQQILWTSVMAGEMLDMDQTDSELRFALGDLPEGFALGNDSLESPVASVQLYNEIFNASAGILPSYPTQRIRLNTPPAEAPQAVWYTIPGSFDQVVFPVLIVPDTLYTYHDWLSIYQLGVPGMAWKNALERESGRINWPAIDASDARMAGWGMASLDLLQQKLLWFSRDSLLLETYADRGYFLDRMAALDWQMMTGQELGVVPSPAEAGWQQEHPGWYLATWYWWRKWRQQLEALDWTLNGLPTTGE